MQWPALVVTLFLTVGAAAQAEGLQRAEGLLATAKTAADAKAVLELVDRADATCADVEGRSLRWQVARLANKQTDHALEVQAWQGVLRYLESLQAGSVDDEATRQYQDVRGYCASALLELRQYDASIAMREAILGTWTRLDAPIRAAQARFLLGRTLLDSGKVGRALDMVEQAHAAMEGSKAGPADRARMNRDCASALADAGDWWNPRLLPLQEQALARWQQVPLPERAEPDYSEFLVGVGWELASTLLETGDFVRARKHAQDALALAEQTSGEQAMATTWPRGLLATIHVNLGDFRTAVELLARNLEVRKKQLTADAFPLQMVRLNHGFALMMAGRHADAVPGFEAAIAVLESQDLREPFQIETLGKLYDNLAICQLQADQGELAEATGRKAVQKNTDPVAKAQAQGSLAWILHRRGRFPEAEKLYAEALDVVLRTQRHRQPCQYLEQRALNYVALGDAARLRDCLERLLAEATKTLEECHRLPGRGSYELAKIADRAAQAVLALAAKTDKKVELDRRAFELLETLRGIELQATNRTARLANLPAVAPQLHKAQLARAELARLASTNAAGDVFTRCQEKERSEFVALYAAMLAAGMPPRVDVTVDAVTRRLPKDAVVVAFRYLHLVDADRPAADAHRDRIEAHVVAKDKGLQRIDLGEAGRIVRAAQAWQEAIEGGEERSAGRPVDDKREDAAKALAGLLFTEDLMQAIGKAKRLIVCLDDPLHTVPIEALPGIEDRRFEFLVSLTELIEPPKAVMAKPTMFAIGDLDYDKAPEEQPPAAADSRQSPASDRRAAAPPIDGTRGGLGDWEHLSGTKEELRKVTESFQRRFQVAATVCTGNAATRAAFCREAQQARFLHFATHGYFLHDGLASESEASTRDAIRGFAPMALCGLALSGGNRTGKQECPDFLGVITGEEIAAMNLPNCELAVLSACKSFQGESRRGHGLASLQAAFHAGGARYVIATRWRVSDEWAAVFMQKFYRGLWELKKPPREALAFARDAVRAETKKVKHWAAFVLTGPID